MRFIEEGRVILPGVVKQELLSGVRSQAQFDTLAEQLSHFLAVLATDTDHILAAKFFKTCQTSGVQGSYIDFLILALAINNSASLLTSDKDFQYYKKHIQFELTLIDL